MTWNVSFKEPVRKVDADTAIQALHTDAHVEGPEIEQCEAAKRAAKELLKSIPGPYVQVYLTGHANGVGWQKKEGWSNDCISIGISQVTEADLPKGI